MEPDIVALMETRLMREATLQSECTLEISSQSFIVWYKVLRQHTAVGYRGCLITFHIIAVGLGNGRDEDQDFSGWVGRVSVAERQLPLICSNCSLVGNVV